MAHNESVSFDPQRDKELIEWLNHPDKKGRKSDTIKKALYLYKEVENALDLANLADKIKLLPKILDVVVAIENRIKNIGAVPVDKDNGLADDDAKKLALDMLEQMESIG